MQKGFEPKQAQAQTEPRGARENRQLLLEVAKRLFAEQGIAATTMKQIASAAGVGKGTLYRIPPTSVPLRNSQLTSQRCEQGIAGFCAAGRVAGRDA